jgi:hypothetical protein
VERFGVLPFTRRFRKGVIHTMHTSAALPASIFSSKIKKKCKIAE